MDVLEFLDTVITTPQGYFELGIRNGTWQQYWYEWPNQRDTILSHAANAEGDVYFTAHLFKSKDSHKDNVLPSRTIQQDLDNADIGTIPLQPSILVNTSPSRHQGFWIASSDFDSLESQELLSKKLAYAIPLCDRSGWSLGHKVRFPNTNNYKYKDGPHPVTITVATTRQYSIDELELLPEVPRSNIPNGTFIDNPPTPLNKGAYELIESIKDKLSAKVYAEYMQDTPSTDRSSSLFALETQLFRAGLSREEVYWIAYNSPNNKFRQDLRFNHERELAKDVIRAEHAVKSLALNIREMVNEIRKKTKVLMAERRRAIYELILAAMQGEGEFVHLVDDRRFYIPRDLGRPIEVEGASEPLHSLLDIKYSLNRTEPEHSYSVNSLISYGGTLPETSQAAILSYYDPASKHVLIHGGRKAIHVVHQDSITEVPNGTYNVLFPWDRIIEPFTPAPSDIDWGTVLFTIPNVINMTPVEARTTLKVWVLFSLLREAAVSRPILAFLGQPGCLSANTVLHVRQGTQEYNCTIEQLYNSTRRNFSPVYIRSLRDGVIDYHLIHAVVKSGKKQLWTIKLTNGYSIRATAEHKILTTAGYINVQDLHIGHKVLVYDPEISTGYNTAYVDSISTIFGVKHETYDIQMEDEHYPNYVANGIVVHNSGKTSTARKLYAFFYGRHMDVSGATSPVNYDIATASLPFYVLDNLDTWEKWIPDRLAQSAGKTDVIVRKLYTNNQVIRIKRQAMVAVTAHDPKFGRADVTDRMLIVSLQRFSNMGIPFEDEGHLLQQVIDNRNKLWGAVISDLQRVLRTPFPQSTDLQLRIQDFARLGEWIAIAIGEQDIFRSAVESLQNAQRAFNLDEDHLLITTILRWITKTGGKNPKTQDELYSELLLLVPSEDVKMFQILYKNSTVLVKRISNLQDTLNNTVCSVSTSLGKNGVRMWHLKPKDEDNNAQ